MHAECPVSANQILKVMPCDDDVELLHEAFGLSVKDEGGPMKGGTRDRLVGVPLNNPIS